MYVINRKGESEKIRYDKITDRNIELSKDLNVDVEYLSKLIISSLKNGMTTIEIDNLSSETAAYMSTYEPDYDILAARIAISNHYKNTFDSFWETMNLLYSSVHPKTGRKLSIITDKFMSFITKHRDVIESKIDYSRDFNYTYFGFKSLQKMYLHKLNDRVVERPQHLLMRVACTIHSMDDNIELALDSYEKMSLGYFTHASPTLFNAGKKYGNLSSCFLLTMDDDLEHIYEVNKRCGLISKFGGGIGIDISRVRAKGSPIHSSNGKSDGLVPMVKMFNANSLYANQSGSRKGSFAMYLEPWHADIFEFVGLRYNTPPDELRARDIFIALWINDLFMKRVMEDGVWSLFCPSVVPQLTETYGEEFEKIYIEAESNKKYNKQIKARKLMEEICKSQTETGLPYIMYKDSVNRKSMQKNIGIIRSSNLCVSGDTLILTKEGHIEIEKLVNKEVEIWNGFEWSTVTPKKTGIDVEMLIVTFSNGKWVKCTKYHKFPIVKDNGQYSFIDAKNLLAGDKLLNHYMPDSQELTNDVHVTSITPLSHLYDTYCFTENKRNLGIFNGVLLGNCSEIVEYTDNENVAVCNLSSIALPKFVYYEDGKAKYNFEKLKDIAKTVTRNLDNVVEINEYPIIQSKTNNLDYRPLGIGVQGLADVFSMFKYTWGSDEAKDLNKRIFETIYYGCVEASTELAVERGSYTRFEGSPWSEGLLQYDMWNEKPITDYDWNGLKEKVKKGMRNSLLTTVMPVAGTSQILGNNEACEPFTSNIYSRSTLAGEFIMMNKHLVKDLKELGLWNKYIINNIIENEGSIQNVEEIPQNIKDIYKTVWEISQKILIDYYRDRAPFIDQAQSLNLFLDHPTIAKLSSMHMYSWKNGCKNGIYYCRSKPARSAVKFNLLKENRASNSNEVKDEKKGKTYVKEGKEYTCFEDVCVACSG